MNIKRSERIERIEYARNHTPKEFSRCYGVKTASARMFYRKHGIDWERLCKYDYDAIKEYAKTHTSKEVAEYFGVGTRNVRSYMKKNGIKWLKHGKPCGEKADMIIYLAQKFSEASIARCFGVSRQWVSALVVIDRRSRENGQ